MIVGANPSFASPNLIIREVSREFGLDPKIALTIAKIESSLNPKAIGPKKEVGLFQLHPKVYPDASFDIRKNTEQGVKALLYWKTRCPYKDDYTWVICYNRGYRKHDNPRNSKYYRKFLREFKVALH